jgi:alkylation response protein AidB-like acyl-CoA dehydrogenase
MWSALAEQGILGLPFPEEDGGLALGPHEMAAVMTCFGRQLSVEPFLSTVVLGGGLLRHLATPDMRKQLLPEIISGTRRMAFAYAEPRSRHNPAFVETRARSQDGSFLLDGTKIAVLGLPGADSMFVSARTADRGEGAEGIGIFLVPTDAPGVDILAHVMIDGRAAAEVRLRNVEVDRDALVGTTDAALPAIDRVLDEARLALCAEAIGAIEQLNMQTLDFCRTRNAFGRPLSSQQVIQHRLVDMHVAAQYASAMVDAAAGALDHPDPRRRSMVLAAAKATVAQEGRFVAQSAVQLHGAIGTTEELPIGRYFKRLLVNEILLGNYDDNVARYGALSQPWRWDFADAA